MATFEAGDGVGSEAGSDRLGREASVEEQRNLLLASSLVLQSGGDGASPLPDAVKTAIAERLKPNASLADLNVAEQLLIGALSGSALDEAVARKLVEAKRRGLPDIAESSTRYVQLQAQGPIDNVRKRAFLLGLVCDLQHLGLRSAQVRALRTQAIALVSRLTGWAVFFAAVPLLVFLLYRASLSFDPGTSGVGKGILWVMTTFPNYGLYTAVTFGALGALFSRYTDFQTATETAVPLDDADAYYSRANVLLHMLIGTVGAMFIYFFAASGLLTGPLVPDLRLLTYEAARSDRATGPFCDLFGQPTDCAVTAIIPPPNAPPPNAPQPNADVSKPGAAAPAPGGAPPVSPPVAHSAPGTGGGAPASAHGITTILGVMTPNALIPSSNLALLIIWAIVAGFSERLVPNLLISTTRQIEARAAEAEKKGATVPVPAAPATASNEDAKKKATDTATGHS